ncbi:MAG: hypothetical protein ABFS35_17920 [Bacteroidota bacterium]
MNQRIGNISNYLGALILLTFGLIYLFKTSFMPYHSEAISINWNEVESSLQFLLLAFMRAVSGGFIATSIVIIILQKKFSSSKIPWIPWLILAAGLIITSTTIYATIIVRINSPGKPPTTLAIVGIVLLVIGYIFNRRTLNALPKK